MKKIEIIKNCTNCKLQWKCGSGCSYSCLQHEMIQHSEPMVYIASALRGDIEGNLKKAQQYTLQAIKSNVLPITPHLYWSSILDDTIQEQRTLGMDIGKKMLLQCSAVWVFGKISAGVQSEIDLAYANGIPVYMIDQQKVLRITLATRKSM